MEILKLRDPCGDLVDVKILSTDELEDNQVVYPIGVYPALPLKVLDSKGKVLFGHDPYSEAINMFGTVFTAASDAKFSTLPLAKNKEGEPVLKHPYAAKSYDFEKDAKVIKRFPGKEFFSGSVSECIKHVQENWKEYLDKNTEIVTDR